MFQSIRIAFKTLGGRDFQQEISELNEAEKKIATQLQEWEKAETAEAKATIRRSLPKIFKDLGEKFPNNKEAFLNIETEISAIFKSSNDKNGLNNGNWEEIISKARDLHQDLHSHFSYDRILAKAIKLESLAEKELSLHKNELTKDCVEVLEKLKSKAIELRVNLEGKSEFFINRKIVNAAYMGFGQFASEMQNKLFTLPEYDEMYFMPHKTN